MEATNKTAEDFGADVLGWAVEELSIRDRNSLTKRLGKYATDKVSGISFKGTWWKRGNTLKYLYSKSIGGDDKKHSVLMGLLFNPIRENLARLPECREIEEAAREATAKAHEVDNSPEVYLNLMNRVAYSRRQMLFLVLLHITTYDLDSLLPYVVFEKAADGKRELKFRKTVFIFNKEEKDQSAAYSLVMNAGKTVDNVVVHDNAGDEPAMEEPETETPSEPEAAEPAEPAGKEGVPPPAEEKPAEAVSEDDDPTVISEFEACSRPPFRENYSPTDDQATEFCSMLAYAFCVIPKAERDAIGRYLRRKAPQDPYGVNIKGVWWESPAVLSRLMKMSFPCAGTVAGEYLPQAFKASLNGAEKLPRSFGFYARVMHGDRTALEELRQFLISRPDEAYIGRIILAFAAGRSLDILNEIVSADLRNRQWILTFRSTPVGRNKDAAKTEAEVTGEAVANRPHYDADAATLRKLAGMLRFAVLTLSDAQRRTAGDNLAALAKDEPLFENVDFKDDWWKSPALFDLLSVSTYPSNANVSETFLGRVFAPILDKARPPRIFPEPLLHRFFAGEEGAVEEMRECLLKHHPDRIGIGRLILIYTMVRSLDLLLPLFTCTETGDTVEVTVAPKPEAAPEPASPAEDAVKTAEPAEKNPTDATPADKTEVEVTTYITEADALAKAPNRSPYKAGKLQINRLRALIFFAVRAVPRVERDAVGRYLRRKANLFPKSVSLKGAWWDKHAVISRIADLSYPASGQIGGDYLSHAFAASVSDAARFPRPIGFFRRVMHGDRAALEELRKLMLSGLDTAGCARIIFLFAAGRSLDILAEIVTADSDDSTMKLNVRAEPVGTRPPAAESPADARADEKPDEAELKMFDILKNFPNTESRTPYQADAELIRKMKKFLYFAFHALSAGELDAIGRNLARAMAAEPAGVLINVTDFWWDSEEVLDFLAAHAYPSSDEVRRDFWSTFVAPVCANRLPGSEFPPELFVRISRESTEALEELRSRLQEIGRTSEDLSRIILFMAATRTLDQAARIFSWSEDSKQITLNVLPSVEEKTDNPGPRPDPDERIDQDAPQPESSAPVAEPVSVPEARPADNPVEASAGATLLKDSLTVKEVVKRFPGEWRIDLPPEKQDATRWLGYVRASQGGFYNFYPTAVWKNGRFEAYSLKDAVQRFPRHGGFNILVRGRRAPCDGALYVAETYFSDFNPNIEVGSGKVRDDYAVRAIYDDLLNDGRFAPSSDFGICIVVYPASDGEPDFAKPIPVRYTQDTRDNPQVKPVGETVLALLQVGDLLYGPVQIKEDRNHNPFVDFMAAVKAGDGLIGAFEKKLEAIRGVTEFAWEGKNAGYTTVTCADMHRMKSVTVDVLTDAQIFERIRSRAPALHRLDCEDFEKALEQRFSERDDANEMRRRRFTNFVSRARTSVADKHELSALVADTFASDSEFLSGIVRSTAADKSLLKTYCENTVIASEINVLKTRLDKVRAEVKTAADERAAEEKRTEAAKAEFEKVKADTDREWALLGLIRDSADRAAELRNLEARHKEVSEDCRRLEKLQGDVLAKINEAAERALGYGETVLPEEMRKSIGLWNERADRFTLAERVSAVNSLSYDGPVGKDLAKSLVSRIRKARAYDENAVLNLYICCVQNFLTVFAGEPGSGKTSISMLLAESLGLTGVDKRLAGNMPGGGTLSRFVNVPVEYGWTTKRDFIGYRNPLTGRFESPDPARWALIRQLDAEARSESGSVWPALMLLDEANLSPMEYYWADFMRLCDGHRNPGFVTLDASGPSAVPDTLRFVATINSDATTETLSPRLIDRAAVVTLPAADAGAMRSPGLIDVSGPLVPWSELTALFGAKPLGRHADQVKRIFAALSQKFGEVGIRLSPRSRAQAENYVGAAAELFADTDRAAWLDAVDFAVMQKLLPRINGTGDLYRSGLESLLDEFERLKLVRSRGILEGIIAGGTDMDSYQFF